MKLRIIQNKLNLLNYILNQEEESLAKQILMTQIEEKFPGLASECDDYIEDLQLPHPARGKISRHQWKSMVRDAIRRKK